MLQMMQQCLNNTMNIFQQPAVKNLAEEHGDKQITPKDAFVTLCVHVAYPAPL